MSDLFSTIAGEEGPVPGKPDKLTVPTGDEDPSVGAVDEPDNSEADTEEVGLGTVQAKPKPEPAPRPEPS